MAIICIAAALILGILGLFSAKYRPLAKEAFSCAFRTLTLRKCDSNLEQKIKANITGFTSKISPKLGQITFKHFSVISTIFVLLIFASSIGMIWGIWNFYQYGNCNGPESTDFCIFDPTGTGEQGFSRINAQQSLQQPLNLQGISYGNENSEIIVYEYGCYLCPYTKKAEPVVQQLREEFKDQVHFVFKSFPLPKHNQSFDAAKASYCGKDQNKYWEMRELLFSMQDSCVSPDVNAEIFTQMAVQLDLNQTQFEICMQNPDVNTSVQSLYDEAVQIGVYGTPTFFIGEKSFVGSVTYDQLKQAIEAEIAKKQNGGN
ncbi:MAG: thioredoxin domain-containing protein [Candidatus Diapherotrites archaeon]|nr:thioredoxin domain-containing protein [Candidatus Diapherotrites archaeon]